MSRDPQMLAGLALLHVLVIVPGMASLMALGLVGRTGAALLAALGPAFLVGVAELGPLLIALLVAGVHVGTFTAVVVSAVVTAVAVVAARRGAPDDRAPAAPRPRAQVLAERVGIGAVALYLVLAPLALINLPVFFDDANIWSRRGVALFHYGELIPEAFRNPQFSYVHLDYPLLQPLLEAQFFHAAGGVDLRLWHAEIWVLFAAAIWTLAWLLLRAGGSRLALVAVAVPAVSPLIFSNITVGDSDATMAAMLGCGVLALGLWLERGHMRYAVLGGLFVGAAGNLKNEGLAFGLAVFVALALVVLPGRAGVLRRHLAVAAGIALASVLPWQLWVAGNDAAQRATQPLWSQDIGNLIDRRDVLFRGLGQVFRRLVETPTWGFVVPAFVFLVIVAIAQGRRRAVAIFYLVAAFLAVLTIGYAYWTTQIADLAGFEERTGPRIVLGVGFIAVAGLAQLLRLTPVGARADRAAAPAPTA